MIDELMDKGVPGIFTVRFLKKDGTVIPCEIHAELIRDDGGEPMYIEGLIEDISDRMHMREIMIRTERMASVTGRIEVRFADSALVTQAIDGTPCELEFAYSLGANASFTFTAHAVYLPVPRIEIPGPQGIQATFDWQAAKATSPTRMCTAVLVNTVTGY